jgi:hypothetical protein
MAMFNGKLLVYQRVWTPISWDITSITMVIYEQQTKCLFDFAKPVLWMEGLGFLSLSPLEIGCLITCLMSHDESLAKCEKFLTRHDINIDTSAEGSRHALRTTHHNSQGLNLIYLGMQGQCFKSTSWRPKHEVQDASGLEQRHLFWIPPMPSHWFTLSLIDGLE